MGEKIEVGDFVKVISMNELGLVGDVREGYLRCWWHRGGTRSVIKTKEVVKVSLEDVKKNTYQNERVKGSLLERRRRLFADEDVSDLID